MVPRPLGNGLFQVDATWGTVQPIDLAPGVCTIRGGPTNGVRSPALPDDIAQRSPLARAWRAFEHALDTRITDTQPTACNMTQP